jgi:hypothetical protein
MTRTHLLLAAVAASFLSLGGGVAVAAPTTAPISAPVPGPKQQIEHLGLSGGLFQTVSGTPRCFTGGGTEAANFPVPRGAQVVGLTAYVIDSEGQAGVSVELNRHSLVSGGTYRMGSAYTSGTPGETTLTIVASPAGVLDEPSSVNVSVAVGDGTCFKGAEVHFLSNTAAAQPAGTARAPEPTVTAVAPDGAVR